MPKQLSPEEIAELELTKSCARSKCKELYGTIQQLQFLLKSYQSKHAHFKRQYELADRTLANQKVEKLSRYKHKNETKEEKAKVDVRIRMLTTGQIDTLIEILKKEVRK